MHLIGDEEGTSESERHAYALQQLSNQMPLFIEHKGVEDVAAYTRTSTALSTAIILTHEDMPHVMKAMLD